MADDVKTEWLPISSAPLDGTKIAVAKFADGEMLWWHKAWKGGNYWNVVNGACQPTHWLPFPPAPPK